MVPPGAVERRARERVEAVEVGQVRMVQYAGGRDHHVGRVMAARGRLDLPPPVTERARDDLLPEHDVATDVVLPCHALEVGADLVAARERVRPVRVGREGVRVEVRRHVARETRVGVLAPRPAEGLGLLVDGDVLVAGTPELDHAQDPGHSRADHHEAQRSRRRSCVGHGRQPTGPRPPGTTPNRLVPAQEMRPRTRRHRIGGHTRGLGCRAQLVRPAATADRPNRRAPGTR